MAQISLGGGTLQSISDDVKSLQTDVTNLQTDVTTIKNIPYPLNPNSADAVQTSAVQNTWYTLANISGIGILTRVSITGDGNSYLEARITIDGAANTLANATTVNSVARGLADMDTGGATDRLDWIGHCFFSSSLLVEYRTTSAGTPTLYAAADYSIE